MHAAQSLNSLHQAANWIPLTPTLTLCYFGVKKLGLKRSKRKNEKQNLGKEKESHSKCVSFILPTL